METIHTAPAMQLIVGHEQLQFVFVDSKTAPQKVVGVYPEFTGGRVRVQAAGLFLKHMTMGVKAITSRRDPSQYRYWEMADFTSDGLAADKVYRLYARVPVSGDSGTFVLHDTFKGMNDEAGFYLLLMGYLGAEREDNRSWGRTYGFTEILPGQITTELIQDPNAQLVIDLANGRITGPLTITAGSVGYNNLTDKPDLTGYLTKSEFKVTADQIRAEVGRANQTAGGTKAQLDAFQQQTQQNVNNLINRANTADDNIYKLQTAGFVTKDGVNAWWSAGLTEKGQQIASYISQTPSAINMIAKNINMDAVVTFGPMKDRMRAAEERITNEERYTTNLSTKVDNVKYQIEQKLDQKQGVNDTIQLNRIKYGDRTIIDRGKIITSLINTDELVVNKAASIGDFYISNNDLISSGYLSNRGVSIRPYGEIEVKSRHNEQTNITGSGLRVILAGIGSTPISCITDSGQAHSFSVTFDHITGDPDWHSYVQLKAKPLPQKNHIAAMPGGHDFKRMVIDINTGLMGWE